MIGTQIAGLRVEADSLVQLVCGERRRFDGVSVVGPSRQLVAVTGASGVGKNLLPEALAGVRRRSAGAIRSGGVTLLPEVLPPAVSRRHATQWQLPSVVRRDDLLARVTIQGIRPAPATLPESSARPTASPTASSAAIAEPGSVPARSIPAGPAIDLVTGCPAGRRG